MNSKNLIFRRVTLCSLLVVLLGFMRCEPNKPVSDQPTDESSLAPETRSTLRYQLFNLELAVEEARHNQNTENSEEARNSKKASYIVAINELKDPCDFDCEPFDYECLIKEIQCKETTETVTRLSLSDGDGDGSDPLPPPSDTSYVANVRLTEMVIFSDDPGASQFQLVTNEGEVYGSNDGSPENFRYDKEKRQAIYKIKVRNPELASRPLMINMTTKIINAAGEEREIELKRPFGLVFRK